MINPEFWRQRSVLVTGHTGFKGSWISLWLAHLGANTTGFALDPPTEVSLFERAHLADDMLSIRGDVRDMDAVRAAFEASQPEIVIHMAAQALVRRSYADPLESFSTNVMGTAHVLEAARHTPSVKAVVIVTSDKCYENNEWVWGYRERDPMGGHDPYSASKGCAELVTRAYRRSFFAPDGHALAVASVRAGNVIGGGDWAVDRLVPDTIRAFSKGEAVALRSPHAIRPWQHVLEPLAGYLRLAERLVAEGARHAKGWNFGPRVDDAQPVHHIVATLAKHWGESATWTADMSQSPHEAHFLRLDCTRAYAELGWRPVLDLDTALAWVARWYAEHERGGDARALTLADIVRYQELAA